METVYLQTFFLFLLDITDDGRLEEEANLMDRVLVRLFSILHSELYHENDDQECVDNRREFIQNTVITHCEAEDTKMGRKGTMLSTNSTVVDRRSSQSVSCCAICLGDFVKGDNICSSPNDRCVHVYHTECMQKWLMNHDDCPQCRNSYLTIPAQKQHEEGLSTLALNTPSEIRL